MKLLNEGQEKCPEVALVTFGPMEAPLYKVNNVYRLRVVVKCRFHTAARRLVADVFAEAQRKVGKGILVSVEVNG